MNGFEKGFLHFMEDWRNPVGLMALAMVFLIALLYWQQTRLLLLSLRRNSLRTLLTALATFVLVLVVTLIWSILDFLDHQTEAKTKNLKAIITEKYQNPSMMPPA